MFSSPITKKSNITEANKHLHLLYDRVSELEKTTEEQSTLLSRKEEEHQEQLATLLALKESESYDLNQRLDSSERLVHDLHQQIEEKNRLINRLQQKADVLTEIFAYKPMLEKMLLTMTYGREDLTDMTPLGATSSPLRVNGAMSNTSTHKTMPVKPKSIENALNGKTELTLEWPQPIVEEGHSPIQDMVNHFGRNVRQFSISNDDEGESSEQDSSVQP